MRQQAGPPIFILLLLIIGCISCSHKPTNTEKRNSSILVGAISGYAIGQSTAPSNERRELHGLYWAGLLGTGLGLITNSIFNDEDTIVNLELENQKLKSDLKLFEQSSSVQIKEGRGTFKGSALQNENQQGTWRLYKVDRWEKVNERSLKHIDQILEVEPPSPNPWKRIYFST